jgi:osmotically-inducible protein OsmY
MNRFPASRRNTTVGSALWAAAGLAALAVAALGSSTRRSALLRDRGGSHLGDRHRFGRRDDDRDERDRGGMTGSSRDRNAGRGYGTHDRSGGDRDEADNYGGQDRSRRMMGSAYGGYGQGGPEADGDYRGRGYGSEYLHGGYDPDNDYRKGMSGYGGRGMGSIPGAFGRSEDDDRRGGDSSQRFRGDQYRPAGDEQGGFETSGHGGYAGTTLMAAHRGRGPKGYTRSDDRIREDVCDRLTDDPHVDASEIDVRVANGEVTLSGTVTDRTAKRHAEDLAERIGGVRHVQNNLRVSPAGAPAGTSGVSATTSSTIDTADVAGAIGITGAPDQTIASGT